MVAANHISIFTILSVIILLSASTARAFTSMTISLPRTSTSASHHVNNVSAAASSSSSSAEAAATTTPGSGRIRGVIFDIDGTLADSWNLGYQATLTVLTDYHNANNPNNTTMQYTPQTYPLTSNEYHYGCRYTTPERLARHAGYEPDHPSFDTVGRELARRFDDYYVTLVDADTAGFYDGIADLLIRLHSGIAEEGKGVKIGALTNACVQYAHAVLKANCPEHSSNNNNNNNNTADNNGDDRGIYRRFSSIHGADSVPRPKPHGDGILQCCDEMNLHPSEVIYIGDAPTDARAAVDAECRAAIGVLWGSNDVECLKEEEGFEVLCGDARELEDAIRKYL